MRGRRIDRQYWGKVRRFFLAHTKRGRAYIEKMHKHRRGECARCGTCCYLGHRCWFLKFDGELAVCSIHTKRPLNCSIYPVDPLDIEERDLLDMGKPCGFGFEGIPTEEKK
jgi:hypothetical protein